MFSYSRYILTTFEATFLMTLRTGLKPLFVRDVLFSLKVAIVDVSFKYFTGVSRIAFDDQLYSTNIAVFRSIDLIGGFKVNSTYMVPCFRFSVAWYAKRSFSLSVAIGGCISLFVSSVSNSVLNLSLVLRIPCFFLFV